MFMQRRVALPPSRTLDADDNKSVQDDCPKTSTEIPQQTSDDHADNNSSRHSNGTSAELYFSDSAAFYQLYFCKQNNGFVSFRPS